MGDFDSIKEQIRSRVDLVDLVSEHVSLRRQGRNHVGLCPFHQEKTPSFSVNADGQFFKCFGCNAGGDIFTFVQLRESVDFGEALQILADRAGVELKPSKSGDPDQPSRADLARVNDWAARFFRKRLLDERLGSSAREYLSARAISDESADAFSIGLATGEGSSLVAAATKAGISTQVLIAAGLCRSTESGAHRDTFRDRLIFPIRDAMRRCIGFGGRTLVEDRAKYINTSQTALFDKSRCLYGIDLAREAITSTRETIVVEGYTDCIAAHQHGFRHTVATLGTAVTDSHMSVLRRYCDGVVLLFDSDEAGEAAADRALAVALKHSLSVRLARVGSGKDPADYLETAGAEGFQELLNSASEALVFKWNRTCSRYRGERTSGQRREAVLDFVTLVASLLDLEAVDAIQLGEIVNQLSKLLSVDAAEVRRLLMSRTARSSGIDRGSSPISSAPRPRGDGEQAALVSILEVLLNAPHLIDRVADVFLPDRIADETCRRIAERVCGLRDLDESSGLSDVLALIEDPAEASAATELAARGSRLEFEATLDGASVRLGQIDLARGTKRLEDEWRLSASTENASDQAETQERLARLGEKLAGHRHFAPRRMINDYCGPAMSGH